MENVSLEINEQKKRRCFSTEEINNLIEMYKNGATYKEMVDKTGMSKTTVCRTLKKMGVIEHRTTRALSDEDVNNVVQMYLDDIPVAYIAEKYLCDVQTVYNYLRSLDIEMTRNSVRKHKFDIHYFDKIDTPNKAYILGLLFADGCNYERSINLFLQASDKQILEDVCAEIGYDGDLEFQDHSRDRAARIDRQDVYGVRFHSAYLCDIMSKHGIVPNKSLVLQFPTCVPDYLLSHFMRGYMDGDGHIGRTKKDNAVSFVSTLSFCESFASMIQEQLGISCTVRSAGNYNGITMQCDIYNKTNKKIFLDWIYQGADLKLERKYNTYISKYCNNDNINNTLTA